MICIYKDELEKSRDIHTQQAS